MTRFDVAVLAVRLLALYLGYETLRLLFSLAYMLARIAAWDPGSDQVLSLLLAMVLLAAFGCALYLQAPAIAGRIFPGSEPLHSASGREIGLLAFKICGLLLLGLFVEDLGRLPQYLKHSSSEFSQVQQDSSLVLVALRGIAAAALIRGAPYLSRRLFRSTSAAPDANLLARLQAVAFSVVGLYFAVNSLWPVVQDLIRSQYAGEFWFSSATWARLVVGAFGVVLFVGGSSLARFWQWMRHAGLAPRAQPPR